MSAGRWARTTFVTAGLYILLGFIGLALGWTSFAHTLALSAGLMATFACVLQVISNVHERKTNGRYRKTLEAHRAGTGGSAGNSTRRSSRRGTSGTGAGMSSGGFIGGRGLGKSHLDQLMHDMLLRATSISPRTAAGTSLHSGGVMSTPEQDPAPVRRPAGEFDGASFAAGVVTGTRSFDVDKLGRLVGVSYSVVWTPGENQAKCMFRDEFGAMLYGRGRPELREARREPHSIADCAHGFYGYYEGSNDFYEAGRVMAVVEGYGETIVGTRGFRASKARIVALHIPSDVKLGRRQLIARNYPGIPIFESFDAMVSEFPPDDGGHGLNPDTDPDFWTREA